MLATITPVAAAMNQTVAGVNESVGAWMKTDVRSRAWTNHIGFGRREGDASGQDSSLY